MGRYSLHHQLLRLPALIILPITYGLIKLFEHKPALTDSIYSNSFYPWVSKSIASLTRKIPFSVTEYAAYGLLAAAAIMLVIRIIKLILLRKEALMRFVSLIITIAIFASYGLFLFYLLWGFNFYRTPIDSRLDLPKREYGADEVYALCVKLADDASALREKLAEDDSGVLKSDDSKTLFASVAEAYADYGSTHELFKNPPPGIKPFNFSGLLSNMRILGFYSCYTAEPNINADQPSLFIGFTAAHESAHYYGWAREDEASFIAYLVCYKCKDKTASYSVTMHALNNCALLLSQMDSSRIGELLEHYSDGMKRDLEAYSRYYNKYEHSQAGDIAEHFNDSYLSFNGQEQGVDAYEHDVDLLLEYYDALGLFIAA